FTRRLFMSNFVTASNAFRTIAQRAAGTAPGTVVYPASLGLACIVDEWQAITKGNDSIIYMERAFFTSRLDDRISILCSTIWKILMTRAERRNHILKVRHQTLKD